MRFLPAFIVFLATFAPMPAWSEPAIPAGSTAAWCVRLSDEGMIIAVSPARQSLQILGTSGTLIGASLDAVANDKHRRAVHDMLEGYDTNAVFEGRIEQRLNEAFRGELRRVTPLGSTAGYANPRDAMKARWQNLAAAGNDVLLELSTTYGIFGPEGMLVAKIEGDLLRLPGGGRNWSEAVLASPEPILGTAPLKDPTKQLAPNLSSPRLSASEDAITKWTEDGGKTLRERYEASVDGAVSALLCALGLAQEAEGEYYLGKLALYRKKFAAAQSHFERALALDANHVNARNGMVVTLAHADKTDDALKLAESLTAAAPDYAPGWMNLAWIQAVLKKNPEAGRGSYEKALALGLSEDKKIEKALGGK